jgi:feruloyl esterase
MRSALLVPIILLSAEFAAGQATLAPKIPCGELRSLTAVYISIATAVQSAATSEVPENCRVTGQILPEVRFEVSLPSAWNGHFYMFGNGGYAGEPLDAPGRIAQRNRALRLGYAVAQTNTGHDAASEPLGTFAMNRQKLLDYAFRAVHVTAEFGKRIASTYYGQPVRRSYFVGCSTGGRQALILAQRFPNDFDGIIVGAPVLDFTGTMINYAWMGKGLAAGPIPTGKLKLLAERIYAECDGRDGLVDGLIDDPRRCGFQPARDLPRCAGDSESPDCFTAAQVRALERIYGGPIVNGRKLFPGFPVGAEVAGPNGRPGWENWIVRDSDRTIGINFAETFFRYMAFPQVDASYDWTKLDFEIDPPRMEWIRAVLDATDPDLTAFAARGGRILMYYGWADPALNAMMGVEYYEKVLVKMGSFTSEFFRLFMVPGMFHCGGGVGCGTVDWFASLVEWVENKKAPESIVGARMVDGKTVRTRPLCPYPQVARYKGSGSIDDAANFTCGKP